VRTSSNFQVPPNRPDSYILLVSSRAGRLSPMTLSLFDLFPLRLLEGHLPPVLRQSPPGLCQLQKWWQPGGEIPPTLQAAPQPGSSLRPGQRRAAPRVSKTNADRRPERRLPSVRDDPISYVNKCVCVCVCQSAPVPEVWQLPDPGVWRRWQRGLGPLRDRQTQSPQTGNVVSRGSIVMSAKTALSRTLDVIIN